MTGIHMSQSIVFIHGIGLGAWIFEPYFKPWYEAQGFKVHCVNLPGHFPEVTDTEKQSITLDSCVAYVEQYLRTHVSASQTASPYVLVGMSMGGAICQRLLAQGFVDDALRGVVLLSPVPPQHNLTFSLRLFRRLAESNTDVLIDFFRGIIHRKLMFAPASLSHMSDSEVVHYLDKMLSGFARLEHEIFFSDLLSERISLPCPIKIIGGEDDLLFTPDVVHFTAAFYRQSAEILSGLGHLIPFETNYQKGLDAIDRFIAEVM